MKQGWKGQENEQSCWLLAENGRKQNKAVAVQILFYFFPSNTIVGTGGMLDFKTQKMFKS